MGERWRLEERDYREKGWEVVGERGSRWIFLLCFWCFPLMLSGSASLSLLFLSDAWESLIWVSICQYAAMVRTVCVMYIFYPMFCLFVVLKIVFYFLSLSPLCGLLYSGF